MNLLQQKYHDFEYVILYDHCHMSMMIMKYLIFNFVQGLEENLVDDLHEEKCSQKDGIWDEERQNFNNSYAGYY
jgi:hypothetical protein